MNVADTFWQHSRIFGYDREKQMVRMFIPKGLYKLFSELNASNEMLIKQVEDNLENLQLILPEGIRPTRKNVINNLYLNLVHGGVNLFAELPLAVNVETIDKLIESYSKDEVSDVDPDLIIRLLQLVKSETIEDFDTSKFISCLQGLRAKRPQIKCKLIVRLERDIAKGTGTMLSPNDRILGDSFKNEIVLTMYRVVGNKEKGWDGKPIWMPNIKFPNDCCFYDIQQEAQ